MALRNCIALSLLAFASPALYAQQGRVAGPVAGYVFDGGAHVLRPVLGIPGASVLGDPVNLATDVSLASVSPRLDSLIAAGPNGSFHFFGLNSGVATEIGVSGIATAPERVVFSPTGSAAAIYTGGRIQVLTGLPSSPVAGSTFDLSSLLALPGGRGHRQLSGPFAVSDDGAYVLVAEGLGVQLLSAGGSRTIAPSQCTALAFLPGTHDAAIAGTGVTLLKDVGGAASPQVLAPWNTSRKSLGLAYSTDATKLYLASTDGVTVFDLAAATDSTVSCDCSPTGITAMGTLFRLNEAGRSPLWLLDPGTPRIVFVPVKSE